MGLNNIQLYNFAKKYIGTRGAEARSYCGLPSSAAWCAAFVSWVFYKGNDANLWYGGKKVVYVPTAERWCFANLAQIPIYLAMPMDVLTFDWNRNGVPDHIGFVRDRKSDTEVYTIEGNTSGGIVACKTRPAKYISGCFRPQLAPSSSWSATKKLAVDGQFGYNSIAVMQRWLGVKVDAVLGQQTIKALQKAFGVAQDGSWGTATSKAIQKKIGVTADGWFGINSVKAFQKYLNEHAFPTPKPAQTTQDKMCAWAKKICDSGKYHYKVYGDDPNTHKCPICYPNSGMGWNCIGYAMACWKHGGGLNCKCNCEVINNSTGDRMLNMSDADLLATAKSKIGLTALKVIRNKSGIPTSQLQKGDLIMYYDGSTYTHLAMYIGNGLITDSARGHSPQVKYGSSINWLGDKVKIAIRYTGK